MNEAIEREIAKWLDKEHMTEHSEWEELEYVHMSGYFNLISLAERIYALGKEEGLKRAFELIGDEIGQNVVFNSISRGDYKSANFDNGYNASKREVRSKIQEELEGNK